MVSDRSPALLLSIGGNHIDRMGRGEKGYELRKVLPRVDFKRVYLFQTGGVGISGWFEAGRILRRRSLAELWETIRGHGVSKSRFDSYLSANGQGSAIEVKGFRRFKKPISLEVLRRVDRRFSVPLSSRPLRDGDPILGFLDALRRLQYDIRKIDISLAPLPANAFQEFRTLVLKEVGRYYDGIDDSFVDAILKTHEEGYDPVGFFTDAKEALVIRGPDRRPIGYTTVTYKKGGCAKTGPTILLERYRRLGFGLKVRRVLEHRVLARGYRKIYCTAPSVSPGLIRYLLKSDYRIEAQLSRQYSQDHDELVFGKLLIEDNPELFLQPAERLGTPARVVTRTDVSSGFIRYQKSLVRLLKKAWFPFDDDSSQRIAAEICEGTASETNKPKDAVLLVSGKRLVGACLLMPKRGGSVKALIVSQTSHTPSLRGLLDGVVEHARSEGWRRIYFLHPLEDAKITSVLRDSGFVPEGVLVSVYAPGQDLAVYASSIETDLT